MNWNAFFGIACLICFTLPIAVILFNRYYKHRSLAALLICYMMLCIYLVLSHGFFGLSKFVIDSIGIFKSFFEVPLMLTALLFFCPNRQKQNIIHVITLSFIAYEVVMTCIHGFKPIAIVYIMGPGYILVLGYAFYLFVKQVKFSIMHGKNHGRMFMLASIFFAYACYTLIYYFDSLVKTPFKGDTELLYFISSIVSSIVMTVGLHLMRRRMKELQSLKLTRKELALFFGQS